MAGKFILSKKASADIKALALRSLQDFGEIQTDVYIRGLNAILESIADNPGLGVDFVQSGLRKTYRRIRYISHVVYYRERADDVFVVRVLHIHMLPSKHL